jgi:hypothetical protein
MLHLASAVQPVAIPQTTTTMRDVIRGEFREMAGLRLTIAQACKLWGLDADVCTAALTELVNGGFLCRHSDGTYGCATGLQMRPRMAKAAMQPIVAEPTRRTASDG